jgi:CRISPR-associated protein Csm2
MQERFNINEIIKKIENLKDLSEENLKPEDYALPDGWAHKIALASKNVKTAQLRKFFNEVKRLYQRTKGKEDIDEVKREIIKLIPELIFAKGRNVITEEFYKLLESCLLKKEGDKKMPRFEKYEEFENFVSFLEAIIAYHKAYA